VKQCERAMLRACEAGISRQRVELLLPLIGATDLDDWCALRALRSHSRGGVAVHSPGPCTWGAQNKVHEAS
jgi:hypothetical protein